MCRRALIALALLYVGVLVGLPVILIVCEAFSQGLQTFTRLFASDEARHAVELTLIVTTCAVAFNTFAGVLIGWTLTKYRFSGKAFLTTLIDLPLSVSPVVVGLAVVFTFGAPALLGNWLLTHGIKIVYALPGLIIATAFVTFPFVAREAISVMDEQGRELEEAALLTGASVWQTFRRITLPNAKWGLLNGIVLCMARAMGEFGAVSVVSGRIRGQTETVPLHIEALYTDYDIAGAFALALFLVLVTASTIIVRIALHKGLRSDKGLL